MIGIDTFFSATPYGIVELLKRYKINPSGKHVVVVGRSNIVGKPIAILLQQKNCTVTMCHSKTEPLEEYTKQGDILVVGIGRARAITKDITDYMVEKLEKGSVPENWDGFEIRHWLQKIVERENL